jgi:uncharacterized protein DUF2752
MTAVGDGRTVAAAARPRSVVLVAITHPFAVGALAVAGAGYLSAVDPHQSGHYPSCPILWVTGRYCPGCGGLRALHDVFHGQFQAAISSNLLVVLALPLVIALWVGWTRDRVSGRVDGHRPPVWFGWSVLAVALVFWVLRNVTATAWLAPG